MAGSLLRENVQVLFKLFIINYDLDKQGAVETPANAGEEFRVFTLGEVST